MLLGAWLVEPWLGGGHAAPPATAALFEGVAALALALEQGSAEAARSLEDLYSRGVSGLVVPPALAADALRRGLTAGVRGPLGRDREWRAQALYNLLRDQPALLRRADDALLHFADRYHSAGVDVATIASLRASCPRALGCVEGTCALPAPWPVSLVQAGRDDEGRAAAVAAAARGTAGPAEWEALGLCLLRSALREPVRAPDGQPGYVSGTLLSLARSYLDRAARDSEVARVHFHLGVAQWLAARRDPDGWDGPRDSFVLAATLAVGETWASSAVAEMVAAGTLPREAWSPEARVDSLLERGWQTPDPRRRFFHADLAVRGAPELGLGWFYRAVCRIRLGDGEGALFDLEQAARRHVPRRFGCCPPRFNYYPEDVRPLRAFAWWLVGDVPRALAACESSLRGGRHSVDDGLLRLRGRIRLLQDDREHALADLRELRRWRAIDAFVDALWLGAATGDVAAAAASAADAPAARAGPPDVDPAVASLAEAVTRVREGGPLPTAEVADMDAALARTLFGIEAERNGDEARALVLYRAAVSCSTPCDGCVWARARLARIEPPFPPHVAPR